MPTPTRARRTFSIVRGLEGIPVGDTRRGRWRLTADFIRVAGGDLRAVRRGDSTAAVLWRRTTGTVRIFAAASPDSKAKPAAGAIVRLAGSPYQGYADIGGHVRFEQVLPGDYLFEVTTPLHEAIEAVPAHVAVTARPGEVVDDRVVLEPLAEAAAMVCEVGSLERNTAVLAGHVVSGDGTAASKARVVVEWMGGDEHADTRSDGWFRICGVPTGKLLLVKASLDNRLATMAMTLAPNEVVHPLSMRMTP